MFRKIQLYILSLWLLFLLIVVKEFSMEQWNNKLETTLNLRALVQENILSIISASLLILGFLFYFRFRYIVSGSTQLPKVIKALENQSYEHLTFLTTYIIPFICFNLGNNINIVDNRELLILVILLIIIGIIYVKTNLFYANPTLAILGYRLYKMNEEGNPSIIIISRDHLKVGDRIHYINLGDNIYFAKK